MKSFKQLREKTLTPAEKKKREEIAKAIEKDEPDMPMDKKMAIATAQAKKVAEGFVGDFNESLDEAKKDKGFVGNSDGSSWAVNIDDIKGGNQPRNLGWSIDNRTVIADFKKKAKKTYVGAKGKATLPAVKKALKMLGATQYFAQWKSDSSSYKDDSVEIWYKSDSIKESVELNESVISDVKDIVAKKQAKKIQGVMVDLFTASAISQIYDKVNDANKAKMDKMKITQLANAAMKIMKREEVELDEAMAFTDKEIKMAIGIASDKRYAKGNMTGAVRAIEKIKKGLSDHPQVQAVLKRQNESLDEAKNYEIKNSKVYISKANFRKVHKDYKNETKGKERMMALDPKTGATTSFPVVFTESVELGEAKDDAEYNDEGGMAISQLKTAKSAVEELMSIIKDDDNLPEWVQSKLTKAVDYMDSVRDYMSSEKSNVQEAAKNALHPSKVEIGDDVSFIHPRTKVRVVGNVTAKFNAVLTVRTVKGKMQIDLTKKGLDAKLVLRDQVS